MKNGKCIKCCSTKIIESIPGDYAHNNHEIEMRVTANPRWLLAGRNPNDVSYGKLRLYVCAECGYTEWWTLDPEKIPIGEEYKTRYL